jgi:Uma2 family endonuclease
MSTARLRPGVQPKRWSKQEYYRLSELGFFQGQRVELIEGRLMVHSPQQSLHAAVVDVVDDVLGRLFGTGYLVRCQLPLDLGLVLEPEPDVVVVPGTRWQYLKAHPTTANLIVEVADTTLDYDRGKKGSLYARAGISDYWIVNVVDMQVEVYRDPVSDPTAPNGHRYNTRTDLRPPMTVSPLALPAAIVAVADLLPP